MAALARELLRLFLNKALRFFPHTSRENSRISLREKGSRNLQTRFIGVMSLTNQPEITVLETLPRIPGLFGRQLTKIGNSVVISVTYARKKDMLSM
jgi:hypothetical protein